MPINKIQLSEDIKTKIIDYILESPLNIQVIPDDIERELYANIFNIIDEVIEDAQENCIPNILKKVKSKLSCCKK